MSLATEPPKVIGTASTLILIQIISSLAYNVLYASLVLFCVQALHLSSITANNIIATFIAFNFALHLVGGFLGGRFISFRFLFLIGMILQTIGCLLLAKINVYFLYLGMAFFLVGAGINVPCINCMIIQLFSPEDKRRESIFLWNYSIMNIGFVVAVTLSGYFQAKQDFHTLFILSSIANLVAMGIMLLRWKKIQGPETIPTAANKKYFYLLMSFVVICACIMFLHEILIYNTLSEHIILLLGVITATALIALTLIQKERAAKNKLIAYLVFAVTTLIFYTLYQLAPMALTLFLERNVDRHVLHTMIPAPWFMNINTVLVIIGCPILAYTMKILRKKGYNVNMPFLFSMSLFLIGAAILILPIGIHEANAKGLVSAVFPATTYILFSFAEIFLSPFGFALVGELAPVHLRGILMSAWLMISGISALLSNIFSDMALGPAQSLSPLISNPSYSHVFFILGIISVTAGMILFFLKHTVINLMK